MPTEPTTSRRGPYAKTRLVRGRIISACAEVLQDSGYHGMTMAEVARRAGISHNGLVHHFPDKDALLVAVLDELDVERSRSLATSTEEARVADPRAALLEMFRRTASGDGDALMLELELALTGEATAPSHPAHGFIERRLDRIRDFLTRAFEDLARRGELAPGIDPAAAAAMTLATVHGLSVQRAYAADAVALDQAGRTLLRCLGLSEPDAPE